MSITRINPLYYLGIGSLVAFVALAIALWAEGRRGTTTDGDLVVYCAAAARKPFEETIAKYEEEYGVKVRPQYGGSGDLLSRIEITKTGDVFLAGDVSHIETARKKGLAVESMPIAYLEPVMVKKKDSAKSNEISGLDDLLRPTVRLALGEPDAAEIGRLTRKLLTEAGRWDVIKQHVTQRGVFKPTEPDLAIAVLTGGADAAILWRSTALQHEKSLEIVPVAELRKGRSLLSVAVLNGTEDATAALRCARYLTATDRGLQVFREWGFEVLDGDQWAERPKLTVFAGSVNRRALQPILERFQQREGVDIRTVFDACGVLVGQMKINKEGGLPDIYVACDVKYLEPVNEQFQDAVNVSNTPIVMCTVKGNPKGIKTLDDLLKPGVRVALGERKMVTIGVLCQRLLEKERLWQKLLDSGNLVKEATSSALLVPDVITGHVDVTLCYQTDAIAERNHVEIIRINSPLARAVQPFSIAKTSPHKYLCRRLLEEIVRARGDYEKLGFGWELGEAVGGKQ